MKAHPIADLFPMLGAAELRQLADDIKANGLREPVMLHEGKILDGRNRHAACIIAKVEPVVVQFSGDDPLSYVISKNLHRRHLDASQRAMVAGKLAKLKDGQRADRQGASKDAATVSQSEAARLLNVSRPSVQRARQVLDHGAPEVIKAVERGEVSVTSAARAVHPAAPPLPPVREHAPEDNDSENLQLLKTYWRRASKVERKAFLAWTESRSNIKRS